MRGILLFVCAVMAMGGFAGTFTDAFKAPNRDAKPWCYWWWQNGNATKESITADLEAMKNLGFGGTLLSDSRGYHDDEDHILTPKPQNTVMDAEWRALIQHVIRECKRIGLQIAFNTATSGGKLCGPWELGIDSPKRLMVRVYPKGAEFEKPDFPFWHDIASFNVKADAADLVKRGWYEAGDGTRTQHASFQNSTDKHRWYKEGVGEEYTVRFGWTTIPGHEYDADVLDPAAVRRFFNRFTGAIMDEAGADLVGVDKTIVGIYSVSWEGVVPMWSPTFEADFRKFAGYDLRTKMTWLAGIAPEGADTEKFMVDCRRARNDMFRENFYGTLAKLAKERGVIMFSENGGPWRREPEVFLEADQLEFLSLNDMPQGEFWVTEGQGMDKFWLDHSKEFVHMRGAVSAGHVYGKKRISVEAFTHMTPHWSISPWTLKKAIDMVFADGGNHVVWHTFSHALDSWGAPGFEYFAGTHINRNVTWHNQAKSFIDGYLKRCEAVLQAGEPVVDIAIKAGNRPYAHWGRYRYQTPDGQSIPAGYNYDLVSDAAWGKTKLKYPEKLPEFPDLEGPWSFCHRTAADEDVYFLQGFSKGEAIFRVKAASALILDAVTGEIKPLEITPNEDGRTLVSLDTTANGSAIVVLVKEGGNNKELANQFNTNIDTGAAFVDNSVAVAGPWDVTFKYHRIDHTRYLPKPMKMEKLTDWTLSSDPCLKYFSGHAFYSTAISLPAPNPQSPTTNPQSPTTIFIGELPSGVASVKVNGVDCGVVWCPPWEARIPAGTLKSGANRIEIEYTNNWQNRLIGDTFLPKADQVTKSGLQLLPSRKKPNGKTLYRFSGYASTDSLQPSGLKGPVVLK